MSKSNCKGKHIRIPI